MNQPNGRADRLAVPLAALLACAALPAFAQSSVTLYGRIDTAIEYANAGPNHVTRMGSGNLWASQWGLKKTPLRRHLVLTAGRHTCFQTCSSKPDQGPAGRRFQ